MSIFGSLYNGISGLQAQSTSLSNISNNIANAQTTGFKRTDTSFEALVLGSNQNSFQPGGVTAKPAYTNDVAGSVSQSQTPTNLAIQGNGFFNVSKITSSNGVNTTSPTQYYTRDGSFVLNTNRVLENDAGYALNGYSYDATTGLYSTQATPIQVTSDIDSPVPTQNVDLKANLPTSPTGAITPTVLQVYDAVGAVHTVTLNWTQGSSANSWNMGISVPDSNVAPVQPLLSTGFPAAVSATSISPNQVDRAQVSAVSLSTATQAPLTGVNVGDVYGVAVNGTNYNLTITASNISTYNSLTQVAQGLADQINGATTSAGVTATVNSAGALQLTANNAGTPFTLNTNVTAGTITKHSSNTNLVQSPSASTPQQSTASYVGTTINNDDVYRMSVNGTAVSVTVTPANYASLGNISGVTAQLAAKINSGSVLDAGGVPLSTNFIATAANGTVTVTARANNTTFTIGASNTDASGTVNTETSSSLIGNVTGSKPKENLSITGQPGDVGTTYSITVRSPSAQTANNIISTPGTNTTNIPLTSSHAAGAPPTNTQSNTYTVGGGPYVAGDNYTVTINGVQVSVPVNSSNVAQFNNNTPPGTGQAAMSLALANAIAGNSTLAGLVNADGTTTPGTLVVTAKTANTPFTIGVGNTNGAATTPSTYAYSFTTPSAPAISTPTSVGQLYTVSLGSSTYNLQITSQNAANYPTVASAVTQLAKQINNDTGAPFTANDDGNGTLTLTTRANGATYSTTPQTVPPSFSQVVSYTTTGKETSLAEIAGDLAQAVNSTSNLPVQATANGGTISMVGNNDSTSFYVQIGTGSQANTPGVTVGKTPGHVNLAFGGSLSDGSAAVAGTLSHLDTSSVGTGNATVSANQSLGASATVGFTVDFGYGAQHINLNVGEFGSNAGQTSSLTQYSGSTINVTSKNQDGAPAGTFQNIQINSDGTVVANYDNGRQSTIAKIPIVLFNNSDALSQQTGNVFTETVDSGKARFNDTNTNGAGSIASSSLEGSNVDIASEFTSLIVTQRTYTANTKVITTADSMINDTLQMKQ